MKTKPKLAVIQRAPVPESLSPELREFLDSVIVPALLKQYLTEEKTENFVEPSGDLNLHSKTKTIQAPRRDAGRNI
jgi:hypothetical protein